MSRRTVIAVSAVGLVLTGLIPLVLRSPAASPASAVAPDGWQAVAPRDEIRPQFTFDPSGGPDGRGGLVIESDGREGLHGRWTKSFPVTGGRSYQFRAYRKIVNVPGPRRSTFANLTWLDAKG